MKKIKTSILFLAVFCFLVLGFWIWWWWATKSLCQTNCQSKIFVVSRGESLGSVAQRLEQEKLIKSSVAFQILVVKEGLTRKIQAGDFRLNPGMSPQTLAGELTHGTLDRWVTLLEGWRREEMAGKLANELGNSQARFDKNEFLALTRNLEGKLFPDTYLLPRDVDAQRVMAILTANFEKKTVGLALTQDALILASIVEREAKHDEDRPIIAGILLKRLARGWLLQADATVQYAVATNRCPLTASPCKEWWPQKLTKEDLKIKSSYNTYLSKGLPPAPIANPGLAAIKAALHPTEIDYWYYLSDKEGKMHYAKTIEEHNENIVKYLLK